MVQKCFINKQYHCVLYATEAFVHLSLLAMQSCVMFAVIPVAVLGMAELRENHLQQSQWQQESSAEVNCLQCKWQSAAKPSLWKDNKNQ